LCIFAFCGIIAEGATKGGPSFQAGQGKAMLQTNGVPKPSTITYQVRTTIALLTDVLHLDISAFRFQQCDAMLALLALLARQLIVFYGLDMCFKQFFVFFCDLAMLRCIRLMTVTYATAAARLHISFLITKLQLSYRPKCTYPQLRLRQLECPAELTERLAHAHLFSCTHSLCSCGVDPFRHVIHAMGVWPKFVRSPACLGWTRIIFSSDSTTLSGVRVKLITTSEEERDPIKPKARMHVFWSTM
jgi:hypothetical protein